ncbi:MAG: M23 family metallopeptidase [Gemmataceae bacterium]|nr:M23 family metallopeptidase [Gemmataceae bacterium]
MNERKHLPAACVAGLFAVAGSAAGWAGDAVFEPVGLLIGAWAGLLCWMALEPPSWPLSAALLGAWAWFASMGCWIVTRIVLGGTLSPLFDGLFGAALGALIGWLVAFLGRRWQTTDWLRRGVVGLLALAAAVGAVLYLALTGPADLEKYPKGRSPYLLPFPAGKTFLCIQGNNAVVSHHPPHGGFAYDFAMPLGAPVCAARAGGVVTIIQHHDGNGLGRPNNFVLIDHLDGTWGAYHHIRKEGARVAVGDWVKQGQVVAECGNVGISALPHVHFEVIDRNNRTMPITFADVPGDGIPRMFVRYTSGNAAP